LIILILHLCSMIFMTWKENTLKLCVTPFFRNRIHMWTLFVQKTINFETAPCVPSALFQHMCWLFVTHLYLGGSLHPLFLFIGCVCLSLTLWIHTRGAHRSCNSPRELKAHMCWPDERHTCIFESQMQRDNYLPAQKSHLCIFSLAWRMFTSNQSACAPEWVYSRHAGATFYDFATCRRSQLAL